MNPSVLARFTKVARANPLSFARRAMGSNATVHSLKDNKLPPKRVVNVLNETVLDQSTTPKVFPSAEVFGTLILSSGLLYFVFEL